MKKLILLLLVFFFPLPIFAATLSLTPANGTYTTAERFTATVRITSDVSINAASGALTFPNEYLSVESISKGSVLNFWIAEPSYSNAEGSVRFEGVSLSGFQGTGGSVISITFRVKKPGSASVQFESGLVLANDGQGTEVTGALSGATYTLLKKPEVPVSASPVKEPEPVEEAKEPAPPVSVTSDTLTAPIIQFTRSGGAEVITGSTYPNSGIVLSFISNVGSKVYVTGISDAEGNFSLPVPLSLKNGSYAVTASILLENGTQSPASEPLSVEVGRIGGFLTWEVATYVSLALLVGSLGIIGTLLSRGYFGAPLPPLTGSRSPLPNSQPARKTEVRIMADNDSLPPANGG